MSVVSFLDDEKLYIESVKILTTTETNMGENFVSRLGNTVTFSFFMILMSTQYISEKS